MTEPIVDAAPAIDFDLKSLPKVSLHDHLDGGLRPATIIELAEAVGHTLPSTDPVALGEWFRESADSGSLVRYLETFDHTVAVMQTKEGLFRVAKEFVEDLADDGVVYGEVRWAPEQHLQKGLSLDEAVEAVQEGLEAGVDAVAESGREIQVGQLITAMRHADRGQEIAELAVRHRNKGAVGFDIAGAEDGFLPSRFKDAFTYLAQHNFPATVHAGEAAGLESIQSALVDGRALRLGHGVRIAEDIMVEFDDEDDAERERRGQHRPGHPGRPVQLDPRPRHRPGNLPVLQPPDRRHRRVRRGHRKPPAGHALPAGLQRHHQHGQPADERRHPDGRVRAPGGDVRLRPR